MTSNRERGKQSKKLEIKIKGDYLSIPNKHQCTDSKKTDQSDFVQHRHTHCRIIKTCQGTVTYLLRTFFDAASMKGYPASNKHRSNTEETSKQYQSNIKAISKEVG